MNHLPNKRNAPPNPTGRIAVLLFALLFSVNLSLVSALPYAGSTPGNKLVASDTADGDELGYSLSVSGDYLLVGAPEEDGAAGDNRGAAYLYDIHSGAEIVKLMASDAVDLDRFGLSVAISGKYCVVGAPDNDASGTDDAGAVYVFDLNTGQEIHKLMASDEEDNDEFGYSVDVFGNYAIVGSWREDGASASVDANRGAAYIFDLTTGLELTKLTADDSQDDDRLGVSVAIWGDYALAGAYREDGTGDRQGAAYLFDISTGTQIAKLRASDPEDADFFGISVAMNEDRIMVGAHREASGADNDQGAVYVFDTSTLDQLFKLSASDAEDFAEFGFRCEISGNLGIVGAHLDSGDGGSDRGAAYVFDLTTGEEIIKVEAADAEDSDRFGIAVAIEGTTAFSGAFHEAGSGTDRGAVYGFEIPDVRPDNVVGSSRFTGSGNNIYNTSTSGQTSSATSRKLRKVKAWVTITSDGNQADDYSVAGTGGNRDFAITNFRQRSTFRTNVTAAMMAGTHQENNLSPEERGRLICAEVQPSSRLKKSVKIRGRKKVKYLRKKITARVTTTSNTWPTRQDAVGFAVKTR